MDSYPHKLAPPPAPPRPLRPLGLPPGSVRALLLLAVVARLVLDLTRTGAAPLWLATAALLHLVSYASARGASAGLTPSREAAPLWLPAGTIRFLALVGLGYGLWLYTRAHVPGPEVWEAGWVLAGFAAGILARSLMRRLRLPDDAGTPAIFHLQALLTLCAATGLLLLALRPEMAGPERPDWVEPLLAAVTAYYAGAR
jgi:hypothetical protein